MSLDVLKSVRGGGRGIRTPVTLSGKAVFKTACFNHSHIPPQVASIYFSSLYDDLRFRFTRRGLHINACRDSITVKLCGSTPSRTLLHRFRHRWGWPEHSNHPLIRRRSGWGWPEIAAQVHSMWSSVTPWSCWGWPEIAAQVH